MKARHLMLSLAAAASALTASADINIVLSNPADTRVYITSVPIAEYAKGRNAVQTVVKDSLDIRDRGSFKTPDFNAVNFLTIGDGRETFYTAPGDKVTVSISSVEPLRLRLSGNPLIDGMQEIEDWLTPVAERYKAVANDSTLSDTRKDEEISRIMTAYDKVLTDFITANPSTPTAAYAVTAIQDEKTTVQMFKLLSGGALTSIVYPLAERSNRSAESRLEAEARQKALESGDAPAPDFTLPSIDGGQVALSSFRGKWVILDFWGSWCIWCIKGFPALKEAYAKYDGKVEVIGIDCGDSEDAWKTAVAKYKLPWVHVYNAASDNSVDKVYGIQGFPTKMIVNPEGKIVDITTGEDPTFFDRLEKFVNQ